MAKYKNQRTWVNGQWIDSRKEAERYVDLLWQERGGLISDLRRQVRFQIIPPLKINGKTAEREAVYVADFVYVQRKIDDPTFRQTVIEDVKGFKTPEYVLKRKLMKWHIRTGDLHDKDGNLYGGDTWFRES